MSLLLTELLRLRLRRAVVVLLLATAIFGAVVFGAHAYNTRPITAEDRAAAEVMAQEQNAFALKDCQDNPEFYGGPRPEDCAQMVGQTTAQDMLWRPQLTLSGALQGPFVALVTILSLVGVLIGTTFVGHDWNTGSMSNQLLFRSERAKVLTAKLLAVALVMAVAATVVVSLFWLGIRILEIQRDIPPPVPGSAMQDGAAQTVVGWPQIRQAWLISVPMVAAAGLAGCALTTLLRSTVAALGVTFAVVALSSIVIAMIFGSSSPQWLLPTNALALLLDGFSYYDDAKAMLCQDSPTCDAFSVVTRLHGFLYLAVPTVLATLAAYLSFSKRDVN